MKSWLLRPKLLPATYLTVTHTTTHCPFAVSLLDRLAIISLADRMPCTMYSQLPDAKGWRILGSFATSTGYSETHNHGRQHGTLLIVPTLSLCRRLIPAPGLVAVERGWRMALKAHFKTAVAC